MLGAVVILVLISVVTYLLFFALPADPALLSCGKNCTPQNIALIHKNLGLDEPIPVQYWHYIAGIFVGRHLPLGHCPAPCFGLLLRQPTAGLGHPEGPLPDHAVPGASAARPSS